MPNILLSALLLSLITLGSAYAQNTAPLHIVASFSILGDMIEQVGGEDVVVDTLVGAGEDAHAFQPTPKDAIRVAKADIIAINGLRFEGWMNRLIKASGTKAKLLVASAGIKPRFLEEAHARPEDEPPVDPHAWQDLRNGKIYVTNIAKALIEARPDKADLFRQRAKAYLAQLETLDNEARVAFEKLPESSRKMITNHDAFGYLAQAYGLTFLSPVGLSTEAEPSAADVAKLIQQIKDENVHTLFLENNTDSRLARQIAKETGAKMGGTLYADTLTAPDGEAPTYLDMMKANFQRLLGTE